VGVSKKIAWIQDLKQKNSLLNAKVWTSTLQVRATYGFVAENTHSSVTLKSGLVKSAYTGTPTLQVRLMESAYRNTHSSG
jgi:hypothetical protein